MSFWLKLSLHFLAVLPGIALLLTSVFFLIGILEAMLSHQELMFQFVWLGLLLAGLWWLYLQLPGWLRKALSKLFARKRGDHDAH